MKPSMLLVLAALGACSPEPRAVSYFVAHPSAANRVVVACQAGQERGEECANADQALAQVRSTARMAEYRKAF